MRRVPVFFYGLFMDAGMLRAKGLNPSNPRRASVQGFALRIGQRATLFPDEKGRVHGILMDISHGDLDRLYMEPGVSMYRPEPVTVDLDGGGSMAALCYNLPAAPAPDEANPDYADELRELARRLGLPSDYVGTIR